MSLLQFKQSLHLGTDLQRLLGTVGKNVADQDTGCQCQFLFLRLGQVEPFALSQIEHPAFFHHPVVVAAQGCFERTRVAVLERFTYRADGTGAGQIHNRIILHRVVAAFAEPNSRIFIQRPGAFGLHINIAVAGNE